MRGPQLGFGRIDLRLRGGCRLFCLIEDCRRGPALRKQRFLTFEIVARLRELGLRGDKVCLCRAQRVLFILRLKSRYGLSGFEPVAYIDRPLDDPARDAKAQCGLVLRLDTPCQNNRRSRLPFRDRDGTHRSRLRRGSFALLPASGEEQRHQRNGQNFESRQIRTSKTRHGLPSSSPLFCSCRKLVKNPLSPCESSLLLPQC